MYKHIIYFLIGCPRTGTTFLHNILKNNNKINLLPKENHFFMTKNVFKKSSHFDLPKFNLKTSNKYYLDQLDINKINYDINTLYFYDLKALKIIKKKFPKSKFFCFLRDPVNRHLSHSLTQIKKYYLYRDRGDFKFPISDFYNLKKSMAFQNQMLSFSNYHYYKNLIKINNINCKYYSYEYLFKKKNNYIKFLNDIQIKNFKKNFDYEKHSQKNYPIKFYKRSYFGKIKSLIFKRYYKKKIDETILKFKEKYPFKFMKKLFLKKDSNLRKHFKTFNFTK